MHGVKNWSSVTWQTKKNLKGFFGNPPVGFRANAVPIPPASPAAPRPSVAAPVKRTTSADTAFDLHYVRLISNIARHLSLSPYGLSIYTSSRGVSPHKTDWRAELGWSDHRSGGRIT